MKYLFINSVYGVRSTGKIIAEQCRYLIGKGHQCMVAYGREGIGDSEIKQFRIGTSVDYKIHALLTRCLDLHGFCSKRATEKLLIEMEKYEPDIIWLHNLHGYYIHIEVLFQWLKMHPEIQIYWTLHDCWSFTGHCAYFTMVGCNKWKSGCGGCFQLRSYPKTCGLDYTKRNYIRKKNAFTKVPNLKLITPSRWLAKLSRESFLAEYPVEMIHNTVDTSIFKPTKSNFRIQNNLTDKYVILGVAVGWEKTKGFQDMLKLRELLSIKYVIVLVGLTSRQIRKLPSGIIGITHTANQKELAAIYTASDVFVNPTHQDNYPTVNLEAAACRTPVLTYDVGGSPESVPVENVFPENDVKGMAGRIVQICENKARHKIEIML